MSKTDKTKPYTVRLREAGGKPWSERPKPGDPDYLPGDFSILGWINTNSSDGGSLARRRFVKRARNKRIRRATEPNLKRTYESY